MNLLRDLRKRIPDVDKDDVLELVGLESRRGTAEKVLPALAIFGAGIVVGAGLGLLLAQKPGRELRGELRSKLSRGRDEAEAEADAPARAT